MNMHFEFDNPTKILFGSGSLNQLGDQAMPGAKAMVLISNGKSTRAGGYLDRTVAQLERAGVQTAVWDGIMENPVKEAIMAGAAFARENGFAQLDIEVRSDNVRAIRLYEKFGFRKLCTFPAFFRIGGQDIDFDVMLLQLPQI